MIKSRKKLLAVHVRAKNTPSGNPNRCYWLLDSTGAIEGAVDEGYVGWAAVRRKFPNAVHAISIETTATEVGRCRNWKNG